MTQLENNNHFFFFFILIENPSCSNKLVSTSPVAIMGESVMENGKATSMQLPANLLVFKCENYERWIAQMKVIFRFQDLFEIVNYGVPALEVNANDAQKAAHKEQRKKDEKSYVLDSTMCGS